MSEKSIDVFGVGNALVDIAAFVTDQFIEDQKLQRGAMTLMDTRRQAQVLRALEHHQLELASGGSAANTMVAIAQSGGSGAYCGKVAHDTHGEFYRDDLLGAGVNYEVELAPETGNPTGTCVVLTTPDAERTMCTHLGVSTSLSETDVDAEMLGRGQFTYIEGYLWDAPDPKKACLAAMEASKRNGVKVAFTFSDPFLVDRYIDDFRHMIPEYCDLLFCNADEARRFCESESLDDCAAQLGQLAETVFLTNSEQGCRAIRDGNITQVDGFPVKPTDSTGAGDAFAGGVLYGLTNGMSLVESGRWGNYIASRVVQVTGPRLEGSMVEHRKQVVRST